MKWSVLLVVLAGTAASAETVRFGRFGPSEVSKPKGTVESAALLLADPGEEARQLANKLSAEGVFVVRVDAKEWRAKLRRGRERCLYPAAELEALSQKAQKDAALPRYFVPTLIGMGQAAALAYASVAQAPPNTFKAVALVDFCPELPVARPFCPGRALRVEKGKLAPAKALPEQFLFLVPKDARCRVQSFAKGLAHAKVEVVGGDLADALKPSLEAVSPPPLAAMATDAGALPDVSDLPLVEVPAEKPGDLLALVVSGDGGWASIDKSLADSLSQRGVAVIGLNSLQYFWTQRTADELASAAERVLQRYLALWKRQRVVLVGFSRGAEVVPLIANRLSPPLAAKVERVLLLSPGKKTSLEFHVSDWFSGAGEDGEVDVRPEALKVRAPVVCAYGSDEEDDSLCPELPSATAMKFPGGHHLSGSFDELADQLLVPKDGGR